MITKDEIKRRELVYELQTILNDYNDYKFSIDKMVDLLFSLVKKYDIKPSQLPLVDK